MPEDRSGGIASFGVSFGEPREGGGSGEKAVFRIVVVSEVVAGADWSTGPTPPLDPIPIDAESFDRVMGRLAPSMAIEVADPFGEREPLRVDLLLPDRKALRPNEIVRQVPALRALADARRVVQDVAARRKSADAARAELARMLPREAWAALLTGEVRAAPPSERNPAPQPRAASQEAPAGAGKPATGIDALLDMVDVGSPDAPTIPAPPPQMPSRDISHIVAAVAKSARAGAPPAPRAVVGTAPERLERAFENLLSSILRHPEVRRLERSWRGLRLLVEQCDKRAGVEVDVVCAPRGSVDEALARLADVSVSRAPADLLVVDQVIEPTAADLEALKRWVGRAEGMLAPVVVGGTAALLGKDSLESVARSTSALSTSDDPRAVAARSVAHLEAARWAAVVLNEPVVRAPYTAATARLDELRFDEDPHDMGSHVFANGAYVVAALCAKSFARVGWATAITGARDGAIGNFAVHMVGGQGAEVAIPLEVAPSDDAVREVAKAGLAMLTCAPNTDAAVLLRAPAMHRTAAGATTTTLADQLFVGRFGRAVQQVAAAIPHTSDPRAAEEVARIALMELFVNAPPSGPEVAAKVDAARGQLTVTVRPRRYAGVGIEEVTLGAALG